MMCGGIDLKEVSKKLAVELHKIMEELMEKFSEPLPGERTPRQEHRDMRIAHAPLKVEDAIVRVTGLWGVSETSSRANFQKAQPSVKSVSAITGEPILTCHRLCTHVLYALTQFVVECFDQVFVFHSFTDWQLDVRLGQPAKGQWFG